MASIVLRFAAIGGSMESHWSRRQFLKTTTAAVVLGAAEKTLAAGCELTAKTPPRQNRRKWYPASVSAPAPASAPSKTKTPRKPCSNGLSARRQLLRHRQLLHPPRHRTAERKAARRIFQTAPQRNLSRHQDRPTRPRRRTALGRDKSKAPANRLPRSDPDPQPEQSRRSRSHRAAPTACSPPSSN